MKPEPYQPAAGASIHGDDLEITYSLEVIAEMVGVSTQTVLHYQELGVLIPVRNTKEFDSENLRHLSRLEYLRNQHELSDGALILVAGLLCEVEQLRGERRRLFRCSGV